MFYSRALRTLSKYVNRRNGMRRYLLLALLAACALATLLLSASPLSVHNVADAARPVAPPAAPSAGPTGEQSARASSGNQTVTAPSSAAGAQSLAPSGSAKTGRGAEQEVSLHHSPLSSARFLPSLLLPSITASKADTLIDTAPGGVVGQANPGDTLQYNVTINNGGSTDATGVKFNDTIDTNTTLVPGSVQTTTVAVNDSYTASGNIRINIAAPGVLSNDADPDGVGPALVVSSAPTTTTQGGNVTVQPNGAVEYNPPAGFEGNDTFTYTISDGEGNTDTATVTFTVSGMIWFIDNTAAASGDGRLTSPFNNLPAFQAVNNGVGNNPANNDNIFLYTGVGNYAGPLTLRSGQKLIGQGSGASLSAISGVNPPAGSDPLPATGGANPNITSSGVGITLSSNNLIRGLNIAGTSGAGITGSSFGTLVISQVAVSATGPALQLSNGTFALTSPDDNFISLSSTNSTTTGISFTTVSGSMKSGSTNIQNPTGIGISVTTAGLGTNGLDFGNTTVNSSGGTGVALTNNNGNVKFGTLTITPDANQRGLFATHGSGNGGSVTTNGGAISTTGAVAVELTRVTNPMPLSVSLTSVSANGDGAGIVLNNTSGSFTITGSGGPCDDVNPTCSGGDIRNTVGANNSVPTTTPGRGISMVNAQNVSLSFIRVRDNQNFGIFGSGVTNFSLANSLIDGANGNSSAFNEGGISITNLLGTSSITNSVVMGGFRDNVRISNNSGTLTQLTVSNSVFKNSVVAGGGNGFYLIPSATALISQVLIQNSTFSGNASNGVQVDASGTTATVANFTVTGSTFSSNGNGGLNFTQANSANLTFNVLNSTLNIHRGNALNVFSASTSTGGSITAKIQNNQIGTPGTFDSGSAIGDGIRVVIQGQTHGKVRIDQNTINEVPNARGIEATTGSGTGGAHFTITNNTVTAPSGTNQSICTGIAGQFCPSASVFVGSNSGNTVCAKVSGNTAYDASNVPLGTEGAYRLAQNSTFNLEGTNANANAEIAATNTVTGAGANPINADAGIVIVPAGTCETVAMLKPANRDMLAQLYDVFERMFARSSSSAKTDRQLSHSSRLRVGGSMRRDILRTSDSVASSNETLTERSAEEVKAAITAQPLAAPAISAALVSGETISLGGPSGFTLPAGKSIVVTFKATINDPFPPATTQVSNQGTVSGDNFGNVLTDDPDAGGTADPTVTPVINPNNPPDAVDDTATVAEDSGANAINVLANDTTAPDSGETLTITAVTQGANGSVAITGGGTGLTYTPNANFSGSDSFTYTISDGNGGSDTATVNVTVTSVNDAPDAVDDSATVAEDSGANTINVLANDSFAPDSGETLTITAVTQGANGSVAITGGGTTVSYTPNANFSGSDSFTYTISDGNGGTDTATVSITVTNVNDNPTANDDTATVAEDSGANAINVLANDSAAPDTGETLTITAVTQGANGSVAITGGGTGVTYTPNANFSGSDSFTYTISDGNGGSDTATVNITVTSVNDNPTANDDTATVAEDSGANAINVLANDSTAPDTGETLTISATTNGANGSVAITGGGTGLTYTPNANFFGSDSFTYTVDDGNGGTDTATVNVTVTNVNDPPDAVNDSATVAEDSGANAINVLANDSTAPDSGETLTITATTNGANGSVTITGGGTGVDYTPNANFFGSDSFTYTISDGNGGSDTATVNITVTNVNDPPDAVNDAATVAEDSGANTINVLANDSFAPDAGETLTIIAVTQGSNGSVAITGGGTTVSYTPNANFFGSDSFTYTISDGNGGTDTATVSITVTNVNDAPDAVDDTATLPEDNGATPINVLANDSFAPDTGETLTIYAKTDGANGTVTITGGGTGLTYTPNANFFGTDSFTYTISDGNGGFDSATVTVTVTPVNDAPVANAGPDQTVSCTAGVVTLDGTASSDVDDPSITLTYVWKEGSTIIATGANPTVILPVGVHTITLTVTDPHGASSQDTVVISVVDDSLPVITLKNVTISLWPPNHEYHTINLTDLVASASDACDGSVDINDVVIAQVTSDETENGNADGNTLKDIIIAPNCKSVQLRAERDGTSDGRVYSIIFLVKDSAGNTTTATATVTVPQSQNGSPAVNSGVHYTVNGGCL